MPVPGDIASPLPSAPVELQLTDVDLERLAETQFGFLRPGTHVMPPLSIRLARGMITAFRPRRMPHPTFVGDDTTALALDWYMVGRDIYTVMKRVERDSTGRVVVGSSRHE